MNDLRTRVAGVLARVYVPLTADDVALCLRTAGLRPVGSDIAGLPEAELERFRRGESQEEWICPALNGENGTAEEEFMTLSSWSLRSRIVFDVLSEAQELMLLRRFSDLALSVVEKDGSGGDLAPMLERIDDLTVHLDEPALRRYRQGEPLYAKLVACSEAAEDAYPTASRTEKAARDAAATRISRFELPETLFGVGA